MAATKPGSGGRPGQASPFGKITVARYREGLRYLTVAVDALRDSFIEQNAAFRLAYTEGTSREPTAVELAPVARGLTEAGGRKVTLKEAAKQVRDAGLSAHEEPGEQEVIVASLIHAAPEALDGFLGLYALLAMPKDEFQEAREAETLPQAVRDAVRAMDDEPMDEQREKAALAWEAMAVAMGYQPGKGWALIARSAWMALTTAMSARQTLPSPSSTGFAPPTEGSADATFSTTPDGARPLI